MNAATIWFAMYWSTPELRRDFDILVRCGRVAAAVAETGHDTPSRWFAQASRSYPPCDDLNALARRACELVAAQLAAGVPS